MTPPDQAAFENEVESAFIFLVEEYGYSIHVNQSECAVVFSTEALSIKVFREPRSYMIYVEIYPRDTNETLVLHEILHVLAPEKEANAQCSGADEVKMKQCLGHLSQLVRHLLQVAGSMDQVTLNRIVLSAKARRTQTTLDAQYGAIRERANDAWERKDWQKARKLYEEARPGLSTTEQRRLEFLLKKNP